MTEYCVRYLSVSDFFYHRINMLFCIVYFKIGCPYNLTNLMIRQSRGNMCVPHKHDVASVEGIHICVYMYMCGHNWFHNWILYI